MASIDKKKLTDSSTTLISQPTNTPEVTQRDQLQAVVKTDIATEVEIPLEQRQASEKKSLEHKYLYFHRTHVKDPEIIMSLCGEQANKPKEAETSLALAKLKAKNPVSAPADYYPLIIRALKAGQMPTLISIAQTCAQENPKEGQKWYFMALLINWLNQDNKQQQSLIETISDLETSSKEKERTSEFLSSFFPKIPEELTSKNAALVIKAERDFINQIISVINKFRTANCANIKLSFLTSEDKDIFFHYIHFYLLYFKGTSEQIEEALTLYLPVKGNEFEDLFMFHLALKLFESEKRHTNYHKALLEAVAVGVLKYLSFPNGLPFKAKNEFELALGFFEKSNTKTSNYQMGKIYKGLKHLCVKDVKFTHEQIEKYQKKAIEYFRKSECKKGLLRISEIYKDLGEVENEIKAILEYVLMSGDTVQYERVAEIYEMGEAGVVNYKLAAEYYLKAKTAHSYYSLGLLVLDGKYHPTGASKDKYHNAANYFRQAIEVSMSNRSESEDSDNFMIDQCFIGLGKLHFDQQIITPKGKNNYVLALEYFDSLSKPNSVADYYRIKSYLKLEQYVEAFEVCSLHLKKIIFREKATKILCKDHIEDLELYYPEIQQLQEELLKSSGDRDLYCLGLLCENNLFTDTEAPYNTAVEFYHNSRDYRAKLNLSMMYAEGHVEAVLPDTDFFAPLAEGPTTKVSQLEKAVQVLLEHPHPECLKQLFEIYEDIKLSDECKPLILIIRENFKKINSTQSLYYEFNISNQEAQDDNKPAHEIFLAYCAEQIKRKKVLFAERSFLKGLILHYQDQNYADALIEFNKAYLNNYLAAIAEINLVEDELEISQDESLSDSDDMILSQDSALATSYDTDELIHTPLSESPLDEESTLGDSPKTTTDQNLYTPLQLDEATESEQEFTDHGKEKPKAIETKMQAAKEEEKEEQASLRFRFSFIDKKLREDYENLQESQIEKINGFFEDITSVRHRPQGIGKPEILKGKYLGYAGCMSRRINKKDRFIYKVKGPGEVLVLSLTGYHHKK